MQLDELNLCVEDDDGENKRLSRMPNSEDNHRSASINNKCKRKDKRMALSKIPVRQIKPSTLIGRKIEDGSKNTDCIIIADNENVEQIKQQTVVENDKIIVEIENELKCNVGKEIENESVVIEEKKPNGIQKLQLTSEQAKPKNMDSSNNVNETILEAPEPFRCKYPSIDQVDDVVDGKEPQLHDEKNTFKPETGDTIQLAPTTTNNVKEVEVEVASLDPNVSITTNCSNCPQELCNNEDNDHITDGGNSLNMHDMMATTTTPATTMTTMVDDRKVCANLVIEASSQVDTSIESGVAQCAQTPGCSRISAANSFTTTSITDNEDNTNNPTTTTILHDNKQEINRKPIENQLDDKLCWRFKNGRLVFETAERKSVLDDDDDDEDDGGNGDVEQVVVDDNNSINCCATDEDISKDCDGVVDVLYSKDLNKPKSRLKSLEDKLKQAGITAYDTNQNVLVEDDLKRNQQELIINNDFCQFDVRQINANLTRFNNGFYCQVYDEKQENHLSSSSSECDSDDESICFINVPKLTSTMGTDGEKTIKHNPDRDNLKSLLKKPGKTKDKKSNRVVFNENKNEFFDADYIILIREECDYDDEDDDGVCTCNQHEMVRLQCCEPNCNCNLYEQGCYDQTPQSPKFAPPIEFVDAVTLSPPEGYKDMELGEEEFLALQQMRQRGQRQAVCRECSATHEDDDDDDDDGGDECHSDTENGVRHHQQMSDEHEEKEKTDQSQQTTPTTPPNDSDNPNYILETITMTTVTEHRIINETEDIERKIPSPSVGSPISGILKGGRLWKQQSLDVGNVKTAEQTTDASITSDEENNSRRSVRFIETESKRDSCDGAPDNPPDEVDSNKSKPHNDASNSPESTEMMLTFKLGNHVLISNNSLKPNSAVRQLFPCTKPLQLKQGDDPEQVHQYLVTAESLRAFEEAKRSKLPQIIQSGETDESIKRAIERNTLRRSLIRYEPRPKKPVKKTDNSLVERIKQLTCDVDNVDETARVSPPGEEARNSPEVHNNVINKNHDKSFSPSSSSTASSNSSSMSSTYRKITDLFGKRGEKLPDVQNDTKIIQTLPDIGGPTTQNHHDLDVKLNPDSRRQFLAPLTACVSSMSMNTDEYYYHLSGNQIDGERASMASSVGTEYSLEDIDEGLKNGQDDENKMIAPDVLAGTPSASESGDELAMFVQQDASRIERIKKKYHSEKDSKDEDDEHDDYGFNHRPSVRGIKPRFGSTTEILQQIQNQLQPPQPGRVAWPYYSESGLSGTDNSKQRNMNQMPLNYQYSNVPEDVKRCFTQPQQQQPQPQYRPTSLQTDDNMYQNCSNQQRCVREVYRSNVNYSTAVVRGEYYQSLPRNQTVRTNNGRPQSPPPLEMSKTYHQTMVYIPYNHIEPIPPQTHPYYHQSNDYARVTNQNQINKRYIEPIYQQRIDPMLGKPVVPRPNGQQQHFLNCSRSESPLPGQFSTARSTQTPSATSCNYYPRYRPMVGPVNWNMDGNYVTKMNRHSFPAGIPRYPPADSVSLTDSESQMLLANGYQQQPQQQRQIEFGMQKDSMPNSPTKPRFIERGVPEGAASVSPQDTVQINQNSSMTSPTSPQNPQPPPSSSSTATTTTKPLFYAMNV